MTDTSAPVAQPRDAPGGDRAARWNSSRAGSCGARWVHLAAREGTRRTMGQQQARCVRPVRGPFRGRLLRRAPAAVGRREQRTARGWPDRWGPAACCVARCRRRVSGPDKGPRRASLFSPWGVVVGAPDPARGFWWTPSPHPSEQPSEQAAPPECIGGGAASVWRALRPLRMDPACIDGLWEPPRARPGLARGSGALGGGRAGWSAATRQARWVGRGRAGSARSGEAESWSERHGHLSRDGSGPAHARQLRGA